MIKHYYPDTNIEEDKYLINASSSLWNKKQDIIKSLNKYKSTNSNEESKSEVPIHELYQFYSESKNKFIVSKRYFENFIKEESSLYPDENSFIKVKSFDNIIL